MCQHTAPASSPAASWDSLARLNGTATTCSCSDHQLAHVGCDCDAQQNLPLTCDCGSFCRTDAEIQARTCNTCRRIAEQEFALRNDFSEYCKCGALCVSHVERAFRICNRCADNLFDAHN